MMLLHLHSHLDSSQSCLTTLSLTHLEPNPGPGHPGCNPVPNPAPTTAPYIVPDPWGRAAQGRAGGPPGSAPEIVTRMCAWQRRTWLAPCGLCCAGTLCLLHSQAARGWLALRLLASPRRPAHFDPPRRLCTRGSAPGPRAPRTAARG